jgi:hypothetical protein
MNSKAYWINTSGTIIPVLTTHIAEVIKTPAIFGYTMERIEAEYAICKEPVGHEGKARQAIMLDLISNGGWIRARYNPRYDSWVVELKVLSKDVNLLLAGFFSKPEIIGACQQSSVKITELSSEDGYVHHHTTISRISSQSE